MKRMKKRLLRNAVSAALTLLLIGSTISCEVGLGTSVDVDRPTVEISYPPKKEAVIRDWFVVSGNAGDDKGMDYIRVTVTNLSSGVQEDVITLSQNGSTQTNWKIKLNENPVYDSELGISRYKLLDGKYSIDAEAVDLEGKSSGLSSIVVEIDNTAPFFISNKPGSELVNYPSEYGSDLNIAGTVAEDHDLYKMEMVVTKSDGTSETLVKTNIPTADVDNGVSFAKWDDDSTKYKVLYGNNIDAGDITFVTSITLEDSAKVFQDPSDKEGVANGNKTSNFYITDKLHQLIAKNQKGLNASEIKDVLNGTSTLDSTIQNEVKTVLKEKKSPNVYFSLNPKNSPSYNIGAFAYKTNDKIGAEASNGMTISVQYTSGLDQKQIEPSSTAVYLLGPVVTKDYTSNKAALEKAIFVDKNWIKVANSFDETAGKYKHELNCDEETVEGNTLYYYTTNGIKLEVKELDNVNPNFAMDQASTSFNYEYTLPAGMKAGRYYFVVAVGRDKGSDTISCVNGSYYGFKGISSGGSDKVVIDAENKAQNLNLKNSSFTNSKVLKYSGTVESDFDIEKVKCKVSVKKDGVVPANTPFDLPPQETSNAWSFEFNLDDYASSWYEDEKEYELEFEFTGVKTESQGDTPSESRNVTVDLVKPQVDIQAVTPYVESGSDVLLNDKVEIAISASDSSLDSWDFTIKVGGEDKTAEIKKDTTFIADNTDYIKNRKVIIPTSAFDKNRFEVIITVKDKAGNVNTYSTSEFFNKKNVKIDQSSDFARIEDASVDSTLSFENSSHEKTINVNTKNFFNKGSDSSGIITLTAKDDDNVMTVEAFYKLNGESGDGTSFYKENINKKEATVHIPLKTITGAFATGDYIITVKVTEENDKVTPATYNVVVADKPAIQITSQNDLFKQKAETVKVMGKVTGKDVTITGTYKVDGTEESIGKITYDNTKTGTVEIGTITENTNKTSGTVTAEYTAKDVYEQVSNKVTYTYKIDGTAPTVTADFKWSDDSAINSENWSTNNAVKITNIAIDGTGSEEKSRSYCYSKKASFANDTERDSETWTVFSKTDTPVIDIPDGEYYVHLMAEDEVGNKSAVVTSPKLKVDTTEPSLDVDAYTVNVSDSSITISGTVSDEAGLDDTAAVTIYTNDNESSKIVIAKSALTNGNKFSKTVPLSSLSEGDFTIKVVAKDLSGKTTTYEKTDKHDLTGPAITVISPSNNLASGTYTSDWQKESTVTVSGTTSDASTVKMVYWSKTKSTKPSGDLTQKASWAGWTPADGSASSWNFDLNSLSEGNTTVYIAAVDEHGNAESPLKLTVRVDTTAPTVTDIKYTTDNTNWSNVVNNDLTLNKSRFKLQGKYADSNSGVKTVKAYENGVQLDASVFSFSNGIWTIDETAAVVSDNSYSYKIEVEDNVGRKKTETVKVLVDTTKPEFSALNVGGFAYAQDKWSAKKTFSLDGTWTENGSGVKSFKYWIIRKDAEDDSLVDGYNPTGKNDGEITLAKGASGWTFKQNFDFEDGYNYFIVKVEDNAKNVSDTKVFNFNVDTTPPNLTITNASNNGNNVLESIIYKKSKDTFTIEGTLSDDVSFINAWYPIRIFAGNYDKNYLDWDSVNNAHTTPAGQIARLDSLTGSKDDKKKTGTFSTTISISDLPKDSDGNLLSSYVISVVGEDYKENRTTQTFTLNIDDGLPSIDSSISNLIERNGKSNNVNGVITVSGVNTDTDSGIISSNIQVFKTKNTGTAESPDYVKDGSALTYNGLITKDSANIKFSHTIDTNVLKTKDGDDKYYIIELSATDRANNTNTVEQLIYADQDTDKPDISTTNCSKTTPAAIKEGANLFDQTGNNQISALIVDDDKLYSVTAEYSIDGTVWTKFYEKTEINSATFTMNAPLVKSPEANAAALELGEYYIRITATDAKTGSEKAVSSTTGEFKIAIDNKAPSVESVTIDDTGYSEGTMFVKEDHTVVLTVSDDIEPVKVEYSVKNANSWTALASGTAVVSGNNTRKTFTHNITGAASSDEAGYDYRITDKYDRKSVKTLTYKVDNTTPAKASGWDSMITVTPAADATSGYMKSGTVTIKGADGIVTDDHLASTIDVSATGDDSFSSKTTNESENNSTDSEKNGAFSDQREYKDGISTVTYTFKDKAGHEVSVDKTIKIDTKAPELVANSVTVKNGTTDAAMNSESVVKEDSVKVTFTALDAFGGTGGETSSSKNNVSNLKKAYIGKGSGFTKNLAEIDLTGKKQTVSNQVISIASTVKDSDNTQLFTDGLTELYIRLEDNAGNVSEDILLCSFTIDRTNPKVEYSGIRNNATVYKKVAFDAKCTDKNLAETAKPVVIVGEIVIYDGNKNPVVNTKSITVTQDTTDKTLWHFTNVDTTKFDDGKTVFQVMFADKAGNESEQTLTVNIDQDADRPVITFNNLNPNPTTKTTIGSKTLSGSIEDSDGPVQYFGIKFKAEDDYFDLVTAKKVTGTTWTYDGSDAEGTYSVYIKVIDAANRKFETRAYYEHEKTDAEKAKADLSMPKMHMSGKNEAADYSGLPFKYAIDKNPPTVDSIKIAAWNGTSYDAFADYKPSSYFGGVKRKAILRIKASDTIKDAAGEKLTVKVNYNNLSTPIEAAWNDETDTANQGYECEIEFPTTTEGEGLFLVNIEAYDDTVTPGRKTLNFAIDNSATHELKNIAPASSITITGEVSLKGIVQDTKLYSPLSKMEFFVPTYSDKDKFPANKAEDNEILWISEGTNTAQYKFTRDSSTWNLVIAESNLASSGNILTAYSGYLDNATNTYLIPVWFRLTDEVGNCSYGRHTVKYDPDGDKPSLVVTSPEHDSFVTMRDETRKPYVILGGEIRVMGTASDNEGVKGIYVQYDVNGDGQFDSKDIEWLSENGFTIENPIPATNLGSNDNDKWGVKASGTYSWQAKFNAVKLKDKPPVSGDFSLEIGAKNDKGELINTDNKTLNIRCRAVDTDASTALASGWSDTIHVSVNNLIPSFSEFKLNRYDSDAENAKLLESIEYEKDMYISGPYWYLEGSVKDNSSFSEISFTNKVGNDLSAPVLVADQKEYTFKLPVVGTVSASTPETFGLRIFVKDNDSDTAGKKENEVTFSINIDNKVPEFQDGTKEEPLVIFPNPYGADTNKLTDKNFLKNSNGSLVTISSKVKEEGAGFKTAAIFVKRPGDTGKTYAVYKEGSTSTGYPTEMSATADTAAADDTFYNAHGLPVLRKTATPTAVNKITVSGIKDEVSGIKDIINVRKSGLVYINGGYRTIKGITKGITDDDVVVELDANVVDTSAASITVDFVYAMTVNNKGETLDTTPSKLNEIKGDDDDGFQEHYTTSGPYTTWEATFDSSKIPDGDVEIHVVVFDRAGNMVHGKVNTRISNNPPRIARVTLATEFNGVDGYSEDRDLLTSTNEVKKFNSLKPTEGVAIWNLDTTTNGELWTVKNKLRITPEIVGGNVKKEAEYSFYIYANKQVLKSAPDGETEAEKTTREAENEEIIAATRMDQCDVAKLKPFNKGDTVEYSNDEIGSSGENGEIYYKFSIWDSTEGSTPGSGYEGAVINIKMKQDIEDNEKPVTVVDKFFWKDNTDNSLYGNSSNNGHIELEADVEKAKSMTGYPFDPKTPKVSGKITIRGSAYDNHRLSTLWISARDSDSNEVFAFLNEVGEGENKVSNKDSTENSKTKDYYKVAEYTPGTGWSSAIDKFSSYGWKFTVTKDELTQHGHYVEWQLDWDTQKMSSKTKKGLVFTMLAKDAVANTTGTNKDEDYKNGSDKNDATANHGRNRPTYEMDVVPYIKAVKTSLSGTYAAQKASVYNRTALGNYPVRTPASNRETENGYKNNVALTTTPETVMLYGFNLNHSTNAVTLDGNVTSAAQTAAKTSEDKYVSYDCETVSFSVKDLLSGNLEMTVNNVPIINNFNNNDAKGTAATDNLTTYANANKYGYNRQPNNSNNNNLTDDVVFDVWEFNDKAALPLNGLLGGVRMQINPENNMIQYAFSNGSQYLSMGGKARSDNYGTTSGNSYSSKYWSMNWDTYSASSIGFHIDSFGNTYATGEGGDTHGTYGDKGGADYFDLFTDRLNIEGRKACSTGTNHEGAYKLVSNLKDDHMDKERVKSVSMASNGNNFYMAYYDSINGEIAFRAGKWGATNSDKPWDNGNNTMFSSKEDAYQAIAGNRVKKEGHENASKYVSIAVVPPKDKVDAFGTEGQPDYVPEQAAIPETVVAVWYDGQALKYAYISDPQNKISTIQTDKNAAGWEGTKTIFASGGLDCQIKVDSSNGIHIAAQDSSGNVKYAYLSSYNAEYAESTNSCYVDCGSVGSNLTLDVAKVGENQVPYISYYSSETKKAKYAYRSNLTNELQDGHNRKTYTGNWEIAYVPSGSRLVMNSAEKINVGVWKADGVLNWSTTNGNEPAEDESNIGKSYVTVTGASNTSTCISVTYGNGSKNAVLGYQIANGGGSCLETAQKR